MSKRLFELQIESDNQWRSCGGFSVEDLNSRYDTEMGAAEHQKALEDLDESTRSNGPSREIAHFRSREIGTESWFYFII